MATRSLGDTWAHLVAAYRGGVVVLDDPRGSLLGPLVPRSAPATSTPEDTLREAIVTVVAGSPGAAIDTLARAAATDDQAVAARASAWARLATHLHVDSFPGATASGGIEVLARRREAGDASLPAPVPVPDAVALECRVVGELLPMLRVARALLGPSLATVDRTAAVADVVTLLTSVGEQARDAGDAALVSFCSRTHAELLHRSGQVGEAAALLEATRAVARGQDDPAGEAACRLLAGDLAAAPATHPDAADCVLFDGGTETSELPWTLEGREADPAAVDGSAAASAYADAAEAFARAGSGRGVALVVLRQASLARTTGAVGDAVELAEHARAMATTAGDGWLAHTAALHVLLGRVAAGMPTVAMDVPETIGRWGGGPGSFGHALGAGLTLNRIGRQWLVRHADADRAATCHALARRLFVALGSATQADQSLADSAQVHTVVGASAEAAGAYEEALAGHLGRMDDPIRKDDAWRRAAGIGLRLHRLALRDWEPATIRRSAERMLGLAALGGGSEDPFVHLLQATLQSSAAGAEVHATLAEGDAARDAGDDARASERWEAALRAADGDDLARAVTLGRLGRLEEAAAAYREHETRMATASQELADQVRAETGVDSAPGLADEAANRLLREATFLSRTSAFEAAVATFEQLDRLRERWWDTDDRPWEPLSEHGRARHAVGQLTRAAELHDLAIAALERRSIAIARDEHKTALNAGSGAVFGRAASTALALDPDDGAAAARSFRFAEGGRARALAELLATTRTASAHGGEAVRAWTAASAEVAMLHQVVAAAAVSPSGDADSVAALRERLAAAQLDLATRTDELRASRAGVARAITPQPPPTPEELAALLPARTALVSHLLVDDELLVYAVTPDGLAEAARVPVDARGLQRTLRSFAAGCATGGAWLDAARDAAALLLSPVAQVLDHAERLYLVPTGVGHRAPLHALPWGEGLLGEQATIALLPSAATLRHLRAPVVPTQGPALVVGDPESMVLTPPAGGRPEPLRPLPFARLEAAAVSARLPGSRLLLGPDATLDAVRDELGTAGLVHLATHAHVDRQVPLATSVLLARGTALRLVDLVGAELGAELVTLSACDSGQGVVTAGDEVLSMTRGLLAAGAASAIVSLWPVDDAATSLLMTRLTDGLVAGLHPAVALQRAQQWYRRLDAAAVGDELRRLHEEVRRPQDPDAVPSPDAIAGTHLRAIDRTTLPPAVAPAHPFNWGAFSYVGAHPAASDH